MGKPDNRSKIYNHGKDYEAKRHRGASNRARRADATDRLWERRMRRDSKAEIDDQLDDDWMIDELEQAAEFGDDSTEVEVVPYVPHISQAELRKKLKLK